MLWCRLGWCHSFRAIHVLLREESWCAGRAEFRFESTCQGVYVVLPAAFSETEPLPCMHPRSTPSFFWLYFVLSLLTETAPADYGSSDSISIIIGEGQKTPLQNATQRKLTSWGFASMSRRLVDTRMECGMFRYFDISRRRQL